MSCRGVGLIFCILFFSGCAYLEEPRWAMLGDTDEKAFFIDREKVQRLPDGNYRYPVKVCLYQKDQRHKLDESHDTNQILYVEINCRDKSWTETGSGVVGQNEKVLFLRRKLLPTSSPINQETIHLAAYNYLCGDDDIIAQHNHQ